MASKKKTAKKTERSINIGDFPNTYYVSKANMLDWLKSPEDCPLHLETEASDAQDYADDGEDSSVIEVVLDPISFQIGTVAYTFVLKESK